MSEYDDDYGHDLYLSRKQDEKWTQCPECKQWLHVQDHVEGSAYCECSQSLPEDDEDSQG